MVSEVKQRHEIAGLPAQYMLFTHLLFSSNMSLSDLSRWDRGNPQAVVEIGPQYRVIPLPVPDPNRVE